MARFAICSRTLAVCLLIFTPVTAFAGNEGSSGSEKVTVCHVPPGNPSNAHTIAIGGGALAAHLAHGDAEGTCAALCRNDGTSCGDNGECCNGLCSEGVCTTPCGEVGSTCGSNGQCCSGVCEGGTCITPCTEDGAACADNDDCCNGDCHDGTCGASCGSNGNSCETGDDCCSGICTDTSKTCASDCTIGGELHGPDCDEELDCCEGYGECIIRLCYSGDGITCAQLGEYCNLDDELNAIFCCFGNVCENNVCVAP
jgi:hypothetical protein